MSQFGRKYSLNLSGWMYCISSTINGGFMKFHPARYSLPGNCLIEGSLSHEHLERKSRKSSGTESESLPLPPHKQMLAAVSLSVSFRSSWSGVDSPESLLPHRRKRRFSVVQTVIGLLIVLRVVARIPLCYLYG